MLQKELLRQHKHTAAGLADLSIHVFFLLTRKQGQLIPSYMFTAAATATAAYLASWQADRSDSCTVVPELVLEVKEEEDIRLLRIYIRMCVYTYCAYL